jgi:hypothetical protein
MASNLSYRLTLMLPVAESGLTRYLAREVSHVNCPHCSQELICAACGHFVAAELSGDRGPLRDGEEPGQAGRGDDQTFLVVAKGHAELLEELKRAIGDLGWVTPIKDRRDDPTILPREGRQGTVHVDQELP